MGNNNSIEIHDAVEIIKKVGRREISGSEAARTLDVSESTVFQWKKYYNEHGETNLLERVKKFSSKSKRIYIEEGASLILEAKAETINLSVALRIIKGVVDGNISRLEASTMLDTSYTTIGLWAQAYVEKGEEYLLARMQKRSSRSTAIQSDNLTTKADIEFRINSIKRFLNHEISLAEGGKINGVNYTTFRDWTLRYEVEGEDGFRINRPLRGYSEETKLKAVKDLLAGRGTRYEICKKYGIPTLQLLNIWKRVYNSQGTLSSSNNRVEGGCLRVGRKTTYDERLQIVKDYYESGKNSSAITQKHSVSKTQVAYWVQKFEEQGEAGLEDRRGRNKKDQVPRTELEAAQKEIAELKHKLYLAEVERDLLKKLDEVERREDYRK